MTRQKDAGDKNLVLNLVLVLCGAAALILNLRRSRKPSPSLLRSGHAGRGFCGSAL